MFCRLLSCKPLPLTLTLQIPYSFNWFSKPFFKVLLMLAFDTELTHPACQRSSNDVKGIGGCSTGSGLNSIELENF